MTDERIALVVDDNATNRLLARTLLKKLGWQSDEADGGAAAIERLRARRYPVILLDISMPGLSGEETCAGLRKILLTPAPRIIAYTAHAFPEDRKRLLSGGFDDILVKPINRQAFDALIAGL